MHWFFILPKTLILGPVWVSFGLKTSNKSLPKKDLKNYQNSMWQFFIQLEKPHFRSIFGHFGPKIPEQFKKKKSSSIIFYVRWHPNSCWKSQSFRSGSWEKLRTNRHIHTEYFTGPSLWRSKHHTGFLSFSISNQTINKEE